MIREPYYGGPLPTEWGTNIWAWNLRLFKNLILSNVSSFTSCHTSLRHTLLSSQNALWSPSKIYQHTPLWFCICYPSYLKRPPFSSLLEKTCLRFKTCFKCHLLWRAFLVLACLLLFLSLKTFVNISVISFPIVFFRSSLYVCLPKVLWWIELEEYTTNTL